MPLRRPLDGQVSSVLATPCHHPRVPVRLQLTSLLQHLRSPLLSSSPCLLCCPLPAMNTRLYPCCRPHSPLPRYLSLMVLWPHISRPTLQCCCFPPHCLLPPPCSEPQRSTNLATSLLPPVLNSTVTGFHHLSSAITHLLFSLQCYLSSTISCSSAVCLALSCSIAATVPCQHRQVPLPDPLLPTVPNYGHVWMDTPTTSRISCHMA